MSQVTPPTVQAPASPPVAGAASMTVTSCPAARRVSARAWPSMPPPSTAKLLASCRLMGVATSAGESLPALSV